MAHKIGNSLHSMEQTFINNKWFVLACIFVAALIGMFIYTAGDYSRRTTSCYILASDVLTDAVKYSFVDNLGWDDATKRENAARALYNSCLLTNGIDIRSVPTFDEIFPAEIPMIFGDDAFELLDSYGDMGDDETVVE